MQVELDDGIRWHVLSGRAGNIVAKADDRGKTELFLTYCEIAPW